MQEFRPMLCPDEQVDLSTIKYPILASTKLDGIRCIFKDGKMLSRSLKEIPNKQLQEKFQPLKDFSKEKGVILDGEMYGIGLTFQQIIHFVMTDDLEAKKQKESLPDNLKFWCFDAIKDSPDEPFIERFKYYKSLKFKDMIAVNQVMMKSKEDVEVMFENFIEEGFEGVILKNSNSKYKFGRATLNSGDCYKVKPYLTFDSEIIKVEERFENTSESYINELGNSQKHSYKDALIPTGIAACFVVMYKDQEQRVMITGEENMRRDIWKNKDNYVGKWIEFKGMLVGSKDKVRHPVFLRYREDKNE